MSTGFTCCQKVKPHKEYRHVTWGNMELLVDHKTVILSLLHPTCSTTCVSLMIPSISLSYSIISLLSLSCCPSISTLCPMFLLGRYAITRTQGIWWEEVHYFFDGIDHMTTSVHPMQNAKLFSLSFEFCHLPFLSSNEVHTRSAFYFMLLFLCGCMDDIVNRIYRYIFWKLIVPLFVQWLEG